MRLCRLLVSGSDLTLVCEPGAFHKSQMFLLRVDVDEVVSFTRDYLNLKPWLFNQTRVCFLLWKQKDLGGLDRPSRHTARAFGRLGSPLHSVGGYSLAPGWSSLQACSRKKKTQWNPAGAPPLPVSSRPTAPSGCSGAVPGKRWTSSGVLTVSLGPDKRIVDSSHVCLEPIHFARWSEDSPFLWRRLGQPSQLWFHHQSGQLCFLHQSDLLLQLWGLQ